MENIKKPKNYNYCYECNIVYSAITFMPSLAKKCNHKTIIISEKQYIEWVLNDKNRIKPC